MHLLNPDCDVDSFFAKLAAAHQAALMLDYDGTLAPFTIERDKAYPYPGLRERLNLLQSSSNTRLVIVSGRRSLEIIPLLGLDRIPEIWGQHGAERRLANGTVQTLELPEVTARGLTEAKAWIDRSGLMPYCECKPVSLAFHWRGLAESEAESIQSRVRAKWENVSRQRGLTLREFNGGLELRAAEVDKGRAVRQLLSELAGTAAVAYLGDNHTDEDAFAALQGSGLSVLVHSEKRPTVADVWVRPPEELLAFIDRWVELAL